MDDDQLQSTSTESESPLFRQQTLEESLASLYKPPYSQRSSEPAPAPSPAPSYRQSEHSILAGLEQPQQPAAEPVKEEKVSEDKNDVWSLLVMSVGGMLLTLGLLLLLFSDDGVVTLQWNAKRWYLYCLAAIPTLYMGIRLLKPSVHDSSQL